jgi:hypothetical protein
MNVRQWATTLAVLALGILSAAPVRAERTSGTRMPTVLNNGARGDITVPYMITGRSTMMVNGYSAPNYYATPIVDDTRNPGVRPVYNVYSFYGATKTHGATEGASPRQYGPTPGH